MLFISGMFFRVATEGGFSAQTRLDRMQSLPGSPDGPRARRGDTHAADLQVRSTLKSRIRKVDQSW